MYFKEHFENLVLTPVEAAQILVLLNIMRDKADESLKEWNDKKEQPE